MIRFICVMVPLVFLINGLTKGDWGEALLFAVAVAVGLTPEMLPMIVTVNLAKGAIAMARKQVIVKRLNAIQNFGAMDVLCTDKTGTLTQDRIILEASSATFDGEEVDGVLALRLSQQPLISPGLKNLLDVAVLPHVELHEHARHRRELRQGRRDPFDFQRRRMSVVSGRGDGKHRSSARGRSRRSSPSATSIELDDDRWPARCQLISRTRKRGDRRSSTPTASASSPSPARRSPNRKRGLFDGRTRADLTLLGYVAFLDPPKETRGGGDRRTARARRRGQDPHRRQRTGHPQDLPRGRPAAGRDAARQRDRGDDRRGRWRTPSERPRVFAKLSPAQKARVIEALHRRGHVVGFLGDGINDGPALQAADVGISVDTAVDIAKESADIILLEKSLLVLEEGVLEGPQGLRQHHQVHQDGRQLELRQHVQRAGGQHLPAVPADGCRSRC